MRRPASSRLQAGGSGVTLSGGTAVTAANCTVASDATVTVPCGTTITTKTLDYNSAAVPSQPCGGIKPPAGTASVNIVKDGDGDPLASNAAVAGAFTHLATVATQTGPSGRRSAPARRSPSATAPARRRASSRRSAAPAASRRRPGRSPARRVGPTSFGTISLGGGITLNFAHQRFGDQHLRLQRRDQRQRLRRAVSGRAPTTSPAASSPAADRPRPSVPGPTISAPAP